MKVSPLSPSIGAELHGVDLSKSLSESNFDEINRCLHEHLVIIFRDQMLSPRQQRDFAALFFDLESHPFIESVSGYPEIIAIGKDSIEYKNWGGPWHVDVTFTEASSIGAVLYVCEVPPCGGDTLFANMYLANETLSTALKTMLDSLIVVQSSAKAGASRSREDRLLDASAVAEQVLEAEHPVVCAHPETGRKVLFVNYGHSIRFKNMTEAESKPLLDYLFAHQTRPEFTCRFQWAAGSMAMWDNRCTQHNPINDYHGFKRVMHRISIN